MQNLKTSGSQFRPSGLKPFERIHHGAPVVKQKRFLYSECHTDSIEIVSIKPSTQYIADSGSIVRPKPNNPVEQIRKGSRIDSRSPLINDILHHLPDL